MFLFVNGLNTLPHDVIATPRAVGPFNSVGVMSSHRQTRPCPRCSLPLTIVRTDTDPTFEYDASKWGRLCHHPDSGGPLTCPGLQAVVKEWLCGTRALRS